MEHTPLLSFEDFEMALNYLVEAFNWRISEFTRKQFYKQVCDRYDLENLMDYAMTFCDRGQGTAAQFLAYLKDERRREVQEGKEVTPVGLLQAAAADNPEWRMPGAGQIRFAKFMALRQRHWQVNFDQVELTEEDLNTIRLTRLSRITPTQAFLQVIEPCSADRRTGGMSSIGEVLGA